MIFRDFRASESGGVEGANAQINWRRSRGGCGGGSGGASRSSRDARHDHKFYRVVVAHIVPLRTHHYIWPSQRMANLRLRKQFHSLSVVFIIIIIIILYYAQGSTQLITIKLSDTKIQQYSKISSAQPQESRSM